MSVAPPPRHPTFRFFALSTLRVAHLVCPLPEGIFPAFVYTAACTRSFHLYWAERPVYLSQIKDWAQPCLLLLLGTGGGALSRVRELPGGEEQGEGSCDPIGRGSSAA